MTLVTLELGRGKKCLGDTQASNASRARGKLLGWTEPGEKLGISPTLCPSASPGQLYRAWEELVALLSILC